MIKVVIDTNIVVSANLSDEGNAAAILSLALSKKILMFVSAPVLAEYEEVLRRPRLKLDPQKIEASLALISSVSTKVLPTARLSISGHEPDNRFYECADAAKADFLITGNAIHFSKDHKNTKVITPREFVDLIMLQLAKEGKS